MTEVIHTNPHDLEQIFALFDHSVAYQENQYKVVLDSTLAMVFSVRYTDKIIWRDLDKGDALDLHRIVVNPAFKGQKLFGIILDWAIAHAKQRGLTSIRMDTWAANPTLIRYYFLPPQRHSLEDVEDFEPCFIPLPKSL